MRLLVSTLRLFLVFFLAQTALAASPPRAYVGGLNVSLTTSGYRFIQADGAATVPQSRIILPGPIFPLPGSKNSFVASVLVQNRSRVPIPFLFNDAGARWTFRVLDADDTVIWDSTAGLAAPQMITEDVLDPGQRWKATMRIPLVVDEVPLPAGTYTLQAFLNADKSVSATGAFEVVADPTLNTGITGLVLRQTLSGSPETGVLSDDPADGVHVTVTTLFKVADQIFPAVIWSGVTDSAGRFVANVPAGRYRVTAFDKSGLPAGTIEIAFPGFPMATTDVTVQSGSFSDVTLRLSPVTPPTISQGIKGTVTRPSIDSRELYSSDGIDLKFSVVFPGTFSVRIEQIELPEGAAPFVWSGMTDYFGRFQVATPPGKFRVTATDLASMATTNSFPPTIMASMAFANVNVEPQTVATVKLVVSPGCVIPASE